MVALTHSDEHGSQGQKPEKSKDTKLELEGVNLEEVWTDPLLLGNGSVVEPGSEMSSQALEEPRTICQRFLQFCRRKLLVILSVLGIVLGFVIGFTVRLAKPSEDTISWIGFPGDIFLNLLKMTIIPLIVSSVITATASMDPKQNGKIGAIQLGYTVATNGLCSIIGLILGATIKPGANISNEQSAPSSTTSGMSPADLIADMIRNMVPDNVVRATLQKVVTQYKEIEVEVHQNLTLGANTTEDVFRSVKSVEYANSTNILGIVTCCVIFGLATAQAKEKGKPFLAFFVSLSDIMIIIITWFLWVSPIGICSLIASSVAAIDDLAVIFTKLGKFVLAVTVGVAVHQIVFLPLIHLVSVRSNPFKIFLLSGKAWFLGFASCASAGSMPYFYKIADTLGIDRRVSSFCIPMGVTLNGNGSSIFICCAVLFFAQLHELALNIGQMCVVGLLTTISSLALPSIPSSSIVVIIIICSSFSIPVSSVGLLFSLEWFLDRIRTTSNIMSEVFAFCFTWRFTRKAIAKFDSHTHRKLDQIDSEPNTQILEDITNRNVQADDDGYISVNVDVHAPREAATNV